MIDVTVALPTWQNKNIIWLQLESLCEQKTEYSWELIICEEQCEGMAGENYIIAYEDRLKKAGCKNIEYIKINDHIPLSKKWVIIANKAQGETFLLCASDNYSPFNRIQFTQDKIKKGFEWVDISSGLFFNLITHQTSTFVNQPQQTGLFMGTLTKHIKNLKGPWPLKGIDHWIRSQADIQPRYRHDKPLLGIHTDGANKISIHRKNFYANKKYRKNFNIPNQKLENILSEDIIYKLKTLSSENALHINHI